MGQQVPTNNQIQNARHDQLRYLGHVDHSAPELWEEPSAASVSDVFIGASHSHKLPIFIFLIEASDKNFAGIAAEDCSEDNKKQPTVSTVEQSIWQA